MIWACISFYSKSEPFSLDRLIVAVKYTNTLEECLLPFAALIFGTNWVFKQDNAPIRRDLQTWRYFHDYGVVILLWPSRNPDFNSFENLWSISAHRVYVSLGHFCTVDEMKAELKKCCGEIDESVQHMLCDSMSKRFKNGIRAHESFVEYWALVFVSNTSCSLNSCNKR